MNTSKEHTDHQSTPSLSPPTVKIVQHSTILYWWPVWSLSLLFSLISFVGGEQIEVGGQTMWLHPSRNLGVIFLTIMLAVILATSVRLRGVISMLAFSLMGIGVLVLSLLGWWDELFAFEQHLSVHLDAGFYLIFGILLFLIWLFIIFVFDRAVCCEFRPGQVVVRNLLGGGTRTYDTRGMSVYKHQDDLFRHILLGMGTGDLHIALGGAEPTKLDVSNVAFVGKRLRAIETMISVTPDHLPEAGRKE